MTGTDFFFLKTIITKHLLAHVKCGLFTKNQSRSYLNHLVYIYIYIYTHTHTHMCVCVYIHIRYTTFET
jgi:hypothetical protein